MSSATTEQPVLAATRSVGPPAPQAISSNFFPAKIEPLQKAVLLLGGQPAILTYVFPKRLVADLGVKLRFKISIICVVMTCGGWRVGFAHATFDLKPELCFRSFLRA